MIKALSFSLSACFFVLAVFFFVEPIFDNARPFTEWLFDESNAAVFFWILPSAMLLYISYRCLVVGSAISVPLRIEKIALTLCSIVVVIVISANPFIEEIGTAGLWKLPLLLIAGVLAVTASALLLFGQFQKASKATVIHQRGSIGIGLMVAIILGLIVFGGGAYVVMQRQSPLQTAFGTPDSLQQASVNPTNNGTQRTQNSSNISAPSNAQTQGTAIDNPPKIDSEPPETYSEGDIERFRLSGASKKCVSFEDVIATTYIGFGHQLFVNESQTMYLLFRFSEGWVYTWESSSNQGVRAQIPAQPASREMRKVYHCENSSMPKTFFEVPSNVTFTELGKQ